MIDSSKFKFSEKNDARSALQRINELAMPNAALFILNDKEELLGSLTDGDIRRGLLKGLTIDAPVTSFMNAASKSFIEGEDNFDRISKFKEAGVRFVPVIGKDKRIIRISDLEQLRSLIPVDAVLMAGGKGERLKPYTDDVPKPMLKIGDKPILVRNIERLANFGISNFHFALRHMADKIIKGLNDYKMNNAAFNYVKEDAPLGTIGSVKLVKELKNDAVLLMNSDLLTNIDFEDFYKRFVDSKADMLVATIPYHIDVPYAVMNINEKEEVTSFQEKPRYTYYSNAGIYLFRKKLIDLIPDGQSYDATDFMEAVIANNKKLVSYPIIGYWLDIGRVEDYYKAQEDVKHIHF